MGPSSIISMDINGTYTPCLIDTGSNVSTVNSEYIQNMWPSVPIIGLESIMTLDVEAANGLKLPYNGVVNLKVQFPGSERNLDCAFLVVPPTCYSSKVPVLIGTNILSQVPQHSRPRCR